MTNRKYELAVFIGRFSPFHKGHAWVVQEGLKIADKVVMIIGSADIAPSIRNPLHTESRKDIIFTGLKAINVPLDRIKILTQHDHTYNEEKWLACIQTLISNQVGWRDQGPKVAIIGYDKDHTTFYMHKFPQWDTIDLTNTPYPNINATEIRQRYFDHENGMQQMFCNHDHYAKFCFEMPDLSQEWDYIKQYKQLWADSPFPVNFVTVDNLVTQSGHLLVVERDGHPGKGQIALPGGFLDPKETLKEGKIRELREETGLKVPGPVLEGSIRRSETYDDPNRSVRGRTITHATWFDLTDQPKLPRVKGASDARKAWWMPISEFRDRRNQIFEDHLSIVENLMGL